MTEPKYAAHQGGDYLEITGPSPMVLTARYPDDYDRTAAEEMVRLANAAPDMLKVLECILDGLENGDNTPNLWMAMTQGAIAKARGKYQGMTL